MIPNFKLPFSKEYVKRTCTHFLKCFLPSLLFFTTTFSQTGTTFPPTSSCTSKDLELVSATLTGGDQCNSCQPGTTLTRTLTLAINNKTGSTRTAFAFWGTLEITHNDGSVTKTAINRCSGPIPSTGPLPAVYDGGNFGTITYQCGDALKMTNLYLAWTDASPKSTCATINSATINPKCGTLPEIQINAGVNGSLVKTDVSCFGASNGSINLTPFGGKSPYTFSWAASNGGVIPTGQVNSQNLSGLVTGTYTCTIKDVNNCSIQKSMTIGSPDQLNAPTSGGDQTQCQQSPIQTLTASATPPAGSIVIWYTTPTGNTTTTTPTLNSVGTVTYYAVSQNTTTGCLSATRTPVILTINAAPDAPTSGGDQTQCQQSPIQTLTATATAPTGSIVVWYTTATGNTTTANPSLSNTGTITYYAASKNSTTNCLSLTRTPVKLTINAVPDAPASGGDQTQCQQSPTQTLTASATAPAGSTVVWYTTAAGNTTIATPTLNSVGTVTYYAASQNSTTNCLSLTRTPVKLTINAAPDAPTSGGDQTQCQQSPIQTLTAGATAPAGATVVWYTTATGNTTTATPILNTVGTVTYYAASQNTTTNCLSLTRTPVKLTINAAPDAPTSGGDQTQCQQSPIQTLTAGATAPAGATVVWYTTATGNTTTATPTLNSVGTVTYYAASHNTTTNCLSLTRTPVKLTINAAPDAPTSGGDQTRCPQTPIQTLTAGATAPAGSAVVWFTTATGSTTTSTPTLNSIGTVTYYAASQNTTTNCLSLTRTPVTLTITSAVPKPTLCVIQPTLCGPATGSLTVLTPTNTGDQYTIDNGANWQTSPSFTGLAAGSNPSIKVKNAEGCISAAALCTEASVCTGNVTNTTFSNNELAKVAPVNNISGEQHLNVKAYPNPFSNKVKFVVTTSVAGNGNLDVYNMMGQKIKTVYQGFIVAGTQTFELSLPSKQVTNLVYVLRMGDNRISGKILQVNQ